MPRPLDISVVVGSFDGPRSSIWRFKSKKSDVYVLFSDRLGGELKFSFHPPNVCRLAKPKDKKIVRRDPALNEWRRDPTPERGSKRAVRVLHIGIATDLLSTAFAAQRRDDVAVWVDPAPAGGSTVLDLMYTNDDQDILVTALAADRPGAKHKLLTYRRLSNGEAFCVTAWHSVA
jgi:hypothetical protein